MSGGSFLVHVIEKWRPKTHRDRPVREHSKVASTITWKQKGNRGLEVQRNTPGA